MVYANLIDEQVSGWVISALEDGSIEIAHARSLSGKMGPPIKSDKIIGSIDDLLPESKVLKKVNLRGGSKIRTRLVADELARENKIPNAFGVELLKEQNPGLYLITHRFFQHLTNFLI